MLCALRLAAQPDLHGVYQSIGEGTTLPGGLKNTGSPAVIELLPGAAPKPGSIDLKKDPWKMCQPVGPFRMMAAERTKIELAQVNTMIVMLFEDLSHGMMRTIYLKRGHPAKLDPTWLGDSIGRWEGDTLVVDTTNFTDKTAFRGASPDLHVIERFTREDAHTLLYRFTIDDPKTWTKPWTGEYSWPESKGPIYEYACHEGNYAMMDILKGARLREKEQAAKNGSQ